MTHDNDRMMVTIVMEVTAIDDDNVRVGAIVGASGKTAVMQLRTTIVVA